MTSIHTQGKKAIDAFRALPWPEGTNLSVGPAAGRRARTTPDCTVLFPGQGPSVPVEVKKSTGATGQLRPIAYEVTVVWKSSGNWWVIAPHELLEFALGYHGQHAISSFECFNPGKPNTAWARWSCPAADVPSRVRAAFEEGESSPLKVTAREIRRAIEALYEGHKAQVRAVIGAA